MNTKSRNTFRLQPAKLIGAAGLGAALSFSAYGSAAHAPAVYAQPMSIPDDEPGASAFWANTASNLNLSIDTTLYGFAMTAMGLNGGTNDDGAAMLGELNQIQGDLVQIENQLGQIDQDLQKENCNLDATSVAPYVTHITAVEQSYKGYLNTGATPEEMQDFLNAVFDPDGDSGNSIAENLVGIKTGLMPNGLNGTGVIGACLATIAPPTAGQLDDTTYYNVVQGLMNYYFDVQAEGMALEAEAYNLKAYEAWKLANPKASITPEQASSICDNATGSTLIYCKQANQAAQDVYSEVQDEFAYAGAPYSTAQYKILNGTNYLYALSLEDFTKAAGVTCSSPLTSSYHCGPTQMSSMASTGFPVLQVNNVPIKYGYYSTWKEANTAVMTALLNSAGDGQTVGNYLSSIGFQNTQDKIIYTGDTTPVSVEVFSQSSTNPSQTYTLGTGICFIDTDEVKSASVRWNGYGAQAYTTVTQPYCSSTDYGKAFFQGLTNQMVGSEDCMFISQSTTWWLPEPGTDNGNFYQTLYATGLDSGYQKTSKCPSPAFQGPPSGVMEQVVNKQSVWPYIDTSTLPCTTNADSSTRSHTNPSKIPTMCGSDFDTWFGAIATKPPVLSQGANTATRISDNEVPGVNTY